MKCWAFLSPPVNQHPILWYSLGTRYAFPKETCLVVRNSTAFQKQVAASIRIFRPSYGLRYTTRLFHWSVSNVIEFGMGLVVKDFCNGWGHEMFQYSQKKRVRLSKRTRWTIRDVCNYFHQLTTRCSHRSHKNLVRRSKGTPLTTFAMAGITKSGGAV